MKDESSAALRSPCWNWSRNPNARCRRPPDRASGLPKPSVLRILSRLADAGMLLRSPPARATSAAPGCRAGARRHDQLAAARERHHILDSLVDEIGETCNCTMLDGDEVVYLDRVETAWPLRVNLQPGSRVPLHCSASGKLFLAHMRREAARTPAGRRAAAALHAQHPVRHAGAGPRIPQHPQRRQLRPRGIPGASSAWPCPSCTATAPWPPWRCTRRWRGCPSTRPAPGCRTHAGGGGALARTYETAESAAD